MNNTKKVTYEKQGYLVIKQFLDEEITEKIDSELELLLKSEYNNKLNIRTPYTKKDSKYPERFDPILDISSLFKKISENQSLLNLVGALLDGPPKILKHKLIIKSPGEKGYPLHQDYSWWHRFSENPNKILSVIVGLDDAINENQGLLEVFPGSHKELYILDGNIPNEVAVKKNLLNGKKIVIEKGDLLIFHSSIPHKSDSNTSDLFRKFLILTYINTPSENIENLYYEYYIKRELSPEFYFY